MRTPANPRLQPREQVRFDLGVDSSSLFSAVILGVDSSSLFLVLILRPNLVFDLGVDSSSLFLVLILRPNPLFWPFSVFGHGKGNYFRLSWGLEVGHCGMRYSRGADPGQSETSAQGASSV